MAVSFGFFENAYGQQVRWHDETTDTLRITKMLTETVDGGERDAHKLTATFGRMFLGTPYVAHTLEGDSELLTVNLSELDCTTFVETAAALAMTAAEGRSSWRDFVYNLERLRYRNGEMNGYPSRLHYICDWILNNSFRGVLEDATTRMPSVSYIVKSIDFMSANRDRYPALANDSVYECIRNVEGAYRNYRFPYVKSMNVDDKQTKNALREGDILAFTSNIKNLDVTHMGILVMKDGEPRVLHASSTEGKVVISDLALHDFLKRNRQFTGIRVIRLK